MYFAYIDESGDSGAGKGASKTYTLGCLLVSTDQWNEVFESLLSFRRRLRDRYGVRASDEIKARYLIKGNGPLRHLGDSPNDRRVIYRSHFQLLSSLPVLAFGVVIRKSSNFEQGRDLRSLAWHTLLQRLERSTRKGGFISGQQVMLIHDEGDAELVRREARKSRRWITAGNAFSGGGSMSQFVNLIEDPSPRASHHNYFIQCSDLVAYSAFRAAIPGSARSDAVCTSSTWHLLDSSIMRAVNSVKGYVPGVVIR